MSHRHTVKTSITDLDIAKAALDGAGLAYNVSGSTLNLTSGDYKGTTIDTKTGTITSGDSDYTKISASQVGVLRQYYSVALHRSELIKQGGSIESQTTENIGGSNCVVMICRTA